MEEDTITIPEGFSPVEEGVTIPEGFEPAPQTPIESGIDLANRAVNLGLAYQQGRTFGVLPKAMAGIGAGQAKILLEGGEGAVKLANSLGLTDFEYQAPEYRQLYENIVRDYQSNINESYERNPILTGVAEGAGGLRTGLQVARSGIGKATNNWVSGQTARGKPLLERATALFSKTAKQSALGGAGYAAYKQGVADPSEQGEGIVSDFATGGTFSGGLGLTGSAVGAGVKAVTPAIDDALAPVVELAKKHNIPVSLDQVVQSKPIQNIQKVSQELPFSGQDAYRDSQLKAFNRALTKTIGKDSDSITPELMDSAFEDVGKKFDDFAGGKSFGAKTLIKHLDAVSEGADEAYSKEAVEAAQKRVKAMAKDFSKDGTIAGEKLNFHRKKINAIARKANDFDKQSMFRDLEDAIIETVTDGDAAQKANLTEAKQIYKNLLAIEPLAAKAKGGNISPTLLNNRVSRIYGRQHVRGKSGDIGELARVGLELLPELGGSDTTQKLLYAGGAVGAGGLAPTTTATALAANRGFQSWINRNPKLVEEALYKAYQKQIPESVVKKIPKQ